ncbi:MAG: hypothetical protein NWR72_00730 [Bacteroidia bacterium]|nr:hypothetical protein [Bacteroidia bacterium]
MSSILSSINSLSDEDQTLIFKAPAIVTVLIAGADQEIDKKEELQARKLVNYRTFTSDPFLQGYYEEVSEQFGDNLEELMAAWSPETGVQAMSNSLREVGAAIKQLPEDHAGILKESLRSLAKKIAEADGGLFHMGGINADERHLMDLSELG